MFEVTVSDNFSSAHQLRNYNGKCEQLHGHNWVVKVTVSGNELNDQGMLIDFKILKSYLKSVIDELDHKFINELKPFDTKNPTTENIARFIFDEIEIKLTSNDVHVLKVKVWENENNLAAYYR
ncbi:MAG: 6-carboxytetrahydropterin synthase QueD [bacterium]|nr:6-carboxytetrahydropterin synthase QueD [bacterium]